MVETKSQEQTGFLRRVGQRFGIIDTPEKREACEAEARKFLEQIEKANQEKIKQIHMLTNHSNACFSEIEYVLGISNYDPHPTHPIEFTECTCEEITTKSE